MLDLLELCLATGPSVAEDFKALLQVREAGTKWAQQPWWRSESEFDDQILIMGGAIYHGIHLQKKKRSETCLSVSTMDLDICRHRNDNSNLPKPRPRAPFCLYSSKGETPIPFVSMWMDLVKTEHFSSAVERLNP